MDNTVAQVEQHLRYQLLMIVVAIKKRFAAEKKDSEKKLDANAAIKLAEVMSQIIVTTI